MKRFRHNGRNVEKQNARHYFSVDYPGWGTTSYLKSCVILPLTWTCEVQHVACSKDGQQLVGGSGFWSTELGKLHGALCIPDQPGYVLRITSEVKKIHGHERSMTWWFISFHNALHTYIPTYIRTYVQTDRQTNTHTQTYRHTCIHAYIQTYIHT